MPETWHAIVDGDGNLISTGTVVADAETLAASGYTDIVLDTDPSGMVWDVATRTFQPPAPDPFITTLQFIRRFTVAEYAAIYSSTDPVIGLFRLELEHAPNGNINLSEARVIGGLQYLVSVGILTAQRALEIGTISES